jgi:hypothetical protein
VATTTLSPAARGASHRPSTRSLSPTVPLSVADGAFERAARIAKAVHDVKRCARASGTRIHDAQPLKMIHLAYRMLAGVLALTASLLACSLGGGLL